MSKQKIKVGFTKKQHETVHAFLEFIKPRAEKELGTPVHVIVDWSEDNEFKYPHVKMTGQLGEKVVPIKDILEANDQNVKGPVLKIIEGGKDERN